MSAGRAHITERTTLAAMAMSTRSSPMNGRRTKMPLEKWSSTGAHATHNMMLSIKSLLKGMCTPSAILSLTLSIYTHEANFSPS